MAIVIKPPMKVEWNTKQSIFLAGTIDNGNSIDWQSIVVKSLSHLEVLILNPRRDDWNSTWEQSINNPQFKEQVEWELDGLERVDQIFINFASHSKSPITLLELGLYASKTNITLVCPPDYWRRGNVEVVAERYNISLCEKLDEGVAMLKKKLV
ncbi:MAG TPA: hypothetical protein EYH38_12375 [Leucothrix sp.]|nr:hypothetical protein [Leucothrix sp.]